MVNRVFTRVFAPGLVALAALTSGCDSKTTPTKLSVSSVVPSVAPVGSSIDVRILGTGFRAGAAVSVGVAATNVVVVSAVMITATVPGQGAGPLDVVVTNPGGESSKLTGGLTFMASAPPPPPIPFSVTSLTPKAGLAGDGGLLVGTGFNAGASVAVDGVSAAFVRVESSTLIRFQLPEHPPGTVDVLITNPDGQTAGLPQGFSYQSVTLSASANSVTAGSLLSVSWVAPSGRPTEDWIAIYKVGAAPDAYGDFWWSYTNGAATGTFTISAPAQPGSYEFRYFGNDGYLMTAKTSVVDVTTAAPALRLKLRPSPSPLGHNSRPGLQLRSRASGVFQ